MTAIRRGLGNPFRNKARVVVVIALLALVTGFLALMVQAALASREQIAGMAARAIARALANNPRLILADDPTGNLDSKTARVIYELLKQIAEARTVLVVTHAEALAGIADRVLHIKDGNLL